MFNKINYKMRFSELKINKILKESGIRNVPNSDLHPEFIEKYEEFKNDFLENDRKTNEILHAELIELLYELHDIEDFDEKTDTDTDTYPKKPQKTDTKETETDRDEIVLKHFLKATKDGAGNIEYEFLERNNIKFRSFWGSPIRRLQISIKNNVFLLENQNGYYKITKQ